MLPKCFESTTKQMNLYLQCHCCHNVFWCSVLAAARFYPLTNQKMVYNNCSYLINFSSFQTFQWSVMWYYCFNGFYYFLWWLWGVIIAKYKIYCVQKYLFLLFLCLLMTPKGVKHYLNPHLFVFQLMYHPARNCAMPCFIHLMYCISFAMQWGGPVVVWYMFGSYVPLSHNNNTWPASIVVIVPFLVF